MVCQIVAPYRNLKIAKCIWCLSLVSPNISLIDFLPSYTILLILRRYSAIWVGCRDSVIQINVFRSLVVLYGAQFLHLLDNLCRRVVFIIFGFCYFFLDLKFFSEFSNSRIQRILVMFLHIQSWISTSSRYTWPGILQSTETYITGVFTIEDFTMVHTSYLVYILCSYLCILDVFSLQCTHCMYSTYMSLYIVHISCPT